MKNPTTSALLPAMFLLCFAPVKAQDPVQVSPDVYSVKLENESVRILEVNLAQGQSDKMHGHPGSTVFVHVISGGKVLVSYQDGRTEEMEVGDNQFLSHASRVHQIKNIGDTDVRAIIYENNPNHGPKVIKLYKERTKSVSEESNSLKLVDEFKEIYNRNDVKLIGLWQNVNDPHEQFFMTGYKNETHYKQFVEKVSSDPKYQKMSDEIEKDRESIEVLTLKPVEY